MEAWYRLFRQAGQRRQQGTAEVEAAVFGGETSLGGR